MLVHHRDNKSLFIQQEDAYDRILNRIVSTMPNNPILQGHKVYSQNLEDGIIAEIFKRIGSGNTFMEIGLQDGTECNTLSLLLSGWRGTWIEGDDTHCQTIKNAIGATSFPGKFQVLCEFVDVSNIVALYQQATTFFKVNELDFFSLDIDGNDYYVIEKLLQGGKRPAVFCVEYNAKFPPPMNVKIKYNPQHRWDLTDYQGASLQAFADLFKMYGYTLVSCDASGINAFFVQDEKVKGFTTYDIKDLYQPPRYHLSPLYTGHAPTLRFLKEVLNDRSKP